MYYGMYNGRDPEKTNTYNFYGLNRLRKPSRGEFQDMVNMSTLEYPCAAPRGPREKISGTPEQPCNNGEVILVSAPDSRRTAKVGGPTGIAKVPGKSYAGFYYNGTLRSDGFELPTDYKWHIARINNLYLINGYKDSDYSGEMESQLYYYNVWDLTFGRSSDDNITEHLIITTGEDDEKGTFVETFRYGYESVYDYDYNGKQENKKFFDEYGYPILTENPFSKVFDEDEEIQISGFPGSNNGGQIWEYVTSSETVAAHSSEDASGNNTIDTDLYPTTKSISNDAITDAIVKGFETIDGPAVGGQTTKLHRMYIELRNKNGRIMHWDNQLSTDEAIRNLYCSGVTIKRRERVFSTIGVHNNRIWGSSPYGNQVYISASDDIFDFTPSSIVDGFAGRIVLDIGGSVVAMTEYGSEMIIFKEDCYIIVYGDSNYSTANYSGIGCIDDRSIVTTPSGIIFLSYKGFYIFSGSVPGILSYKLNTEYTEAISGYDGEIYYTFATVKDKLTADNKPVKELLTYNTRYGTWHIQDSKTNKDQPDYTIKGFFRFRDGFYIVDSYDVYRTDSGTEKIQWSATSIRNYDNNLDSKSLNEIWVKADISPGAFFMIATAIGDEDFCDHVSFYKTGLNIHRIPVRAKNGDSYTYKISGQGKVVFYEIEIHRSTNGQVYKVPETTQQLKETQHSKYFSY